MAHKVLNGSLAVALTVSAAFSLSAPRLIMADANGDRDVDVLDLQLVISMALNKGETTPQADVNGDGQVDILDFQYILMQAQVDSPQQPPAAPGPDPATIVLAKGLQPGTSTNVSSISFITQGKRVATAALRARSAPLTIYSPKEERYFFRLMPNAPPVTEQCVHRALV